MRYRSDAMAAIHETMEALREIGAVDKQTMRRFKACLTPAAPLSSGEEIVGGGAEAVDDGQGEGV